MRFTLRFNNVNNITNVIESGGEPRACYLKTKQTNIFIPCPIDLQDQLNQ